MTLELLEKKLAKAKKNAEYERERYARIRAWAIWYLGGKCAHCEGTENLEIHEIEPVLEGRGKRQGWRTLKRWMTLIPQGGCVLLCRECHITLGHHGNTNDLKKVKRDNERK
jgi:hypothetical protein